MWDTERGRSNVSASAGRCRSRKSANSARNASTSGSNSSGKVLLCDRGPMLGGAAEHQLTGLGPFQGELQIVLPGEAHGPEQLEAVAEHHRLTLPRGCL